MASLTTSTLENTMTDPDAETSTVATVTGTAEAVATFSAVPLPRGMPNKIFPKDSLTQEDDLSGLTLISILFTYELNWYFVINDPISSSQIFAYIPALIAGAIEVPNDGTAIKNYALSVFIPDTYHSAADMTQLGTMWLGYIPTDMVDTLAAAIKAKNSKFYTGIQSGAGHQLAQHVNPGFSLLSVADPNAANNGGSNGNGGGDVTGGISNGKSRQDAIIGVTSALGAIALFVLIFLVYRSLKRRRELAHRRLSDPIDYAGYRPEGREFDRDSVGGQRRRSFYFAEDSLRVFQGQGNQGGQGGQGRNDDYYDHRTMGANAQMSQVNRRNVAPNAISAPILRESSMNW